MSSFVQQLFMVFIPLRVKQGYGGRAVTSDFSRVLLQPVDCG
jgi:hypothetical protein